MNRSDPEKHSLAQPSQAQSSPTVTLLDRLFLEKTNRDIKSKNIWGDTHVPKFRLIKISKWSTKCSDREFYSNRQICWYFFQFSDYCVPYISKTNEVWNLKQTPKVAHIIHMQPVYILDWSTKHSGRKLCWTEDKNIQFFSWFWQRKLRVIWVC